MLRGLIVFLVFSCFGYSQHKYVVDVVWEHEDSPLEITQIITFTNTSKITLNALFLLDWNHAYSSERSPLGKFLANEFDYKLIRTNKQKRGETHIVNIQENQNDLHWKRLANKRDIIEVMLPYGLKPQASFTFTVTYKLQLPSAGVFKFGKSKNELFVNFWHLLLATLESNGSWTLNSNLGFGLPNSPEVATTYSFTLPPAYRRILPRNNTKKPSALLLTTSDHYTDVPFGKASLLTNMLPVGGINDELKKGMNEIVTFLNYYFDFDDSFSYRALQKEYNQKPLLALESFPMFVGAFDKTQVQILRLLKTLLDHCVFEKYGKQEDASSWLLEGLPYYLWYKFVEAHYPDLKISGKLSTWPIIKNYHFTQAPYYRSWELAANVSANKNRGQALITPQNKRTRYNRKVANPNRAALALMYLDAYLGENVLESAIVTLPQSSRLDSILRQNVTKQTNKPIDWFFDYYIYQDNNADFSIYGKKIADDSFKIRIKSTQKQTVIPIDIEQIGGTTKTFWLSKKEMPYTTTFNKNEVASITINKNHLIPEWSLNNNSFNPNKKIFRNNLRLRLLQDIPKSGTAVLLATPEFSYNLYDGFLGGISLGNNSILSNRYRFKLSPQFGTTSKKLNGIGYVNANRYYENRSHYLTRFTLFGSSFHYAPKKRYTVFSPSIQFYYRPKGIQNNQRSYLNLRHVSVRLQGLDNQENLRNYGVSLASFESRIGNALKNITYKSEFQWASPFKKISVEGEYITYYAPNRRWNFRAFGGLFFQNKDNDSYFDFNASRVNDYLFRYDLYGRSENDGFFSQQYIKAEGALRTVGLVSSANRWLITAQTCTTLWRWIEGYAEIGFIKNVNHKTHTHWGTGVTFNIIPDFFEIYFPLYDNTGNLLTKNSYPKQIRFQLSLRPSALAQLFSRSWF